MKITLSLTARILCIGIFVAGGQGCKTKAQTGTAAGAGLGAIMGQAIGRNTGGTLIGTAVGAGAGYIIGNEMDKSESRKEQRRREQAKARAAEVPAPQDAPSRNTYLPPSWPDSTDQMKPLADTSWRVVSMSPPPADRFSTMTVHFQPNGLVISTIVYADGRVTADSEAYRVVGNTLIVNDIGYLTNSTWSIQGNRLTLQNQDFSTTLERVGDGD